jgi:BASS family bile acid:Na+ symporter
VRDLLELALIVTVPVFTAGSLLAVGLRAAARDAFAPLMQGRFVGVVIFVGWVVCPAVALLLLAAVPIDRPYAAGLLVLSLAPAAPFAPAMMLAARADSGHTAAFMILSTVATVAILPVAAPMLIGGVSTPPLIIARPLLLFVLLPLLMGLAVRHLARDVADRAARWVGVAANTAGAIMLLALVPLYGGGMIDAVGSYAIALLMVFVAVVTLASYAAGAVLAEPARIVVTLGICSRNLGAALAPLPLIEPDPRALVMIALAVPITLGASIAVARRLARPLPVPHSAA